ncbi:ribulose kinase [Catalinimonas alkaloidigena]|uniref:hypothetical protein n=1 Tax=Catalinimonas alkaloidigena TaxID=1075417 RepID=UPI0024054695|nr:hypothetical protein [Catalinimonas alkaloidigena]MDF9800336.1 ribulose kinase [Catalinimonas alkaloidigena]
MTKIIIEIDNEKDKKLIKDFLDKLGIESQEAQDEKTPELLSNGKEVASLMQELAESTGLSEIKDPVAWQREIRQDRKLPFRD